MNSTFALPRARQSLYAMLVAAVLAVGSLAGAIPAHAADVFLQGRVVDAEGKPLHGIQVSAFSGPDAGVSGVPADTTGTTNTLGQYSLALASDRTYRLRYTDTQIRPDGPYITEWHQNAAGPETAVPVTVTSPGITLPDTSLAAPALEQFTDAPVPVLTGTGAPGTVLTVDPGTWSPEPVLTYTWYRNGTQIGSGTSLTVSPSYGGGNITVKVTAKKSGYTTTTRESAPVAVPLSNLNPNQPTITGIPQGGSTLFASYTGPARTPTTHAFQWFRDGVAITPTSTYYNYWYTPVAADLGKRLTVQVTWTLPGYHPVTRTSAPTHPVTPGVLVPTDPVISGEAATSVDQMLTVTVPAWGPGSVGLKYQWHRDGAAISGATGLSYRLAVADVGTHSYTVKVTGTRSGFTSASTVSVPFQTTVSPGSFKPSAPTFRPVYIVGSKWAASSTGWPAGTTLKYQWYRDGSSVKGATVSTYWPTSADLGKHTYTVRVTGSKPGYTTLTKTSAPYTGTVAKGTLRRWPSQAPFGTAKVGYTLTADLGLFEWDNRSFLNPNIEPSVKYQWYRGSTAIKGATGKTYKLTGADAGKAIKVHTASTMPGFNVSYQYSPATRTVAKGTLKASTPTISGTKKVGYRLTANPRTWTAGTKFTYQWYRSGRAIKGATGRTYKLVTADRYDTIKIKVTGYQTGYNTVAKTSAATSKVR